MQTLTCDAIVKQVPAGVNTKQRRAFFCEVVSELEDCPCIVLDCSALHTLDKATGYLMVCCLEEALRRNGDARLAALPPRAAAMLTGYGMERVFHVYASTREALHSFREPRGPIADTRVKCAL